MNGDLFDNTKRDVKKQIDFIMIDTHNAGSCGGIVDESDVFRASFKIRDEIKVYDYSQILIYLNTGLDVTNAYLKNAYISWSKLRFESVSPEEHSFLLVMYDKTSMFVGHDLRVFVDKMIAMVWCHDNDGENYKIKIDGTVSYFSERNTNYKSELVENHRSFLETLGMLDNAYKHSLINLNNRKFGTEEPCVYSL